MPLYSTLIRCRSRVRGSIRGKEQRTLLHLSVVAIEKGAIGSSTTIAGSFTYMCVYEKEYTQSLMIDLISNCSQNINFKMLLQSNIKLDEINCYCNLLQPHPSTPTFVCYRFTVCLENDIQMKQIKSFVSSLNPKYPFNGCFPCLQNDNSISAAVLYKVSL